MMVLPLRCCVAQHANENFNGAAYYIISFFCPNKNLAGKRSLYILEARQHLLMFELEAAVYQGTPS